MVERENDNIVSDAANFGNALRTWTVTSFDSNAESQFVIRPNWYFDQETFVPVTTTAFPVCPSIESWSTTNLTENWPDYLGL